jgi:nucleotide-binding universal stress UspA family protein
VAQARDLAKLHGGRLLLLHVVELPTHFGPDTARIIPEGDQTPIGIRDYAVRMAESHLEHLARRVAVDGVEVASFTRVGHPVEEIERAATEQGADLIVMGTHGRTGARRLIAGSVTERVVRTSSIPVLTVRHPEA